MQSTIEWVSVDEKLPDAGERVLFATDSFVGEGYTGFWNDRKVWFRLNVNYEIENVLGKVKFWSKMPEFMT